MTKTNKGYSAEEVKAMAETKGLECRIVKSRGLEIVKPQATLEALGLERVWSRYMTAQQAAEDLARARSKYTLDAQRQMAEDAFSRIEKSNAAIDRLERRF